MTFGFTQDVPIGPEQYSALSSEIGVDNEPPKGLVAHIAIERPEGGLRYIDVWESEDDWSRFRDDRLHPALDRLLGRLGIDPPDEPEQTPIEVVDVLTP